MPYSIFQELGLEGAKPTTVTLQLADRSITHPWGVVEDVLVNVADLILPADFLILEMEADKEVSIILGRPFLATGRTSIDVADGILKMRVHDQEVTFNIFNTMKYIDTTDECFTYDQEQSFLIQEKEHEDFSPMIEDDSMEVKYI
ncbi:hypothetical protein MLD38_010163 [Melastoma candidum]|uniref:Uncharacterized protein n=1 Tax=Melastoma candidum TaxID=119954 RepID=A0ACB9QYY6_9MYRT|nr:hypothetical protein MLD38_010163 [Melastoma candidum]